MAQKIQGQRGSVTEQKQKAEEQKKRVERYSQKDGDYIYATLLVEGAKLYVYLDILITASPVFKTMFETKNFKEGIEKEVELPDKSLQSIIWMLDYLYPDTNGHLLTDLKAAALLPLAFEYQIERLKTDCINELKKMNIPRLETATLAHKYQLEDLLKIAVEACTRRINSFHLDKERERPENQGLPLEIYYKIIREKLRNANKGYSDSYILQTTL